MLKTLKQKIGLMSLALVGMFGFATAGLCAPSSTPAEVLDTVVSSGINTSVSLVETVVTTYFPYILVFGIIVALFVWIKRFATTGTK